MPVTHTHCRRCKAELADRETAEHWSGLDKPLFIPSRFKDGICEQNGCFRRFTVWCRTNPERFKRKIEATGSHDFCADGPWQVLVDEWEVEGCP